MQKNTLGLLTMTGGALCAIIVNPGGWQIALTFGAGAVFGVGLLLLAAREVER